MLSQSTDGHRSRQLRTSDVPGHPDGVTALVVLLSETVSTVRGMTSAEHEAPVALVKNDPALVAWLLPGCSPVAMPAFDRASARPGDLQVLTPRTYHADATVLFTAADEPVYAVIVEVQRARDPPGEP